MTSKGKTLAVIVDSGKIVRGSGAIRDDIPVARLASEIERFVEEIGEILDRAAKPSKGKAVLSEVELSASIEVGGKLSLLGTGVETKGQAGIKFKFIVPTG
jgi:hypothetical protein